CFGIGCRFFFSSRRRHTRFSRDWSSDVCSSDLTAAARDIAAQFGEAVDPSAFSRAERAALGALLAYVRESQKGVALALRPPARRSEERRVGKEWRPRGGRAR